MFKNVLFLNILFLTVLTAVNLHVYVYARVPYKFMPFAILSAYMVNSKRTRRCRFSYANLKAHKIFSLAIFP